MTEKEKETKTQCICIFPRKYHSATDQYVQEHTATRPTLRQLSSELYHPQRTTCYACFQSPGAEEWGATFFPDGVDTDVRKPDLLRTPQRNRRRSFYPQTNLPHDKHAAFHNLHYAELAIAPDEVRQLLGPVCEVRLGAETDL